MELKRSSDSPQANADESAIQKVSPFPQPSDLSVDISNGPPDSCATQGLESGNQPGGKLPLRWHGILVRLSHPTEFPHSYGCSYHRY